ncbi:hypothetical protein PN419_00495 [Halorubrum ezzemoulense]|uniref:hypothetical protein n=1 Tax=Halorubrum ezzemoulense TaxID=337243 RepID=UPI0023309EAD|nr:hypothetical protein [Halorubrum ezzemoulense]MDB9247486.1 hypothetical protein [Halorubrum ezzemoulense]MDB9258605.1 hypothetical protein [Halorubrum ezzemoulense]MDB9264536.1 hypothetical protein [Halorubrum ezzemoulense]MDB9268966.1 hypothetical protein [Halorubrum ezzemoulense]MDB9271504.1 hypothetical protein [Halorubrum ezzemoulense]
MRSVDSKDEYDRIVAALADELAAEIDNGAARNVANHVIASFEIRDGVPLIGHSAEYEGGPIDTLDETLNPYDVLTYSEATLVSGVEPNVAAYAAQALTEDLYDARGIER